MINVCSPACHAADSLSTDRGYQYWLDAGVGFGNFRGYFAVGANIALTFQNRIGQFTFRFNPVSGMTGHGFDAAPSEMRELGILYGRVLRMEGSCASISAGIGYTQERSRRFGFPLEAALYAGQLKWVGVSLKVCANITPGPKPGRSYWLFGVGLIFGKLQ